MGNNKLELIVLLILCLMLIGGLIMISKTQYEIKVYKNTHSLDKEDNND